MGPWQGTFTPAEPTAPQPPLLQGQPQPQTPDQVKGGYALDVDAGFDKDHFCHSGRQVHDHFQLYITLTNNFLHDTGSPG